MKKTLKGQAAAEYLVTTLSLIVAIMILTPLLSGVTVFDEIRFWVVTRLIASNNALRQPIP